MKRKYYLASGDEHASIHGCLERDVAIAEEHILSLCSDGPLVRGKSTEINGRETSSPLLEVWLPPATVDGEPLGCQGMRNMAI